MKKINLALLLLLFIAGSFFTSVQAQTDTSTNLSMATMLDMDLATLMNMEVVSASKVKQKQSDAPNIITAIPRERINIFGYGSLNEILYSQPGFFPAQDYERRTLGFRGMFEGWNNNHTVLLIDGLPFNDNLYGTAYTWENTPLHISRSIEIIRGPGGALYGTNAMNGVISINTLDAADVGGIGMARLRAGSLNTKSYDFITGQENDKVGFVAVYNYFSTDGNEYDTYDGSLRTINPNSTELKKFRTKDTRSSSYFFNKIYGKGKLQGLSMQVHDQRWSYETGHGWLFTIPDREEDMKENRNIVALRYAPDRGEKPLGYEFSTRYQRHQQIWNMRFYPDNTIDAYGTLFPWGASEFLNTKAEDVFARAQGSYTMDKHVFLAGAEADYFIYNGDKEHYSNYDMNTWAAPDSTGKIFSLNPWFEYVKNKPVMNFAGYMQYLSPKFFNLVQVTLSGRYDQQMFDYKDISSADSIKPTNSKTFDMFTPRIALVFTPMENLTIKGIAGRAFRTPSPTEMFGTNTYTLASNINELKSEVVTNYDLGIEWQAMQYINLRLNAFMLNFENQIAYSVANNNLSTNIYTLTTAGIETEINYSYNGVNGFLNLTQSKRLDEKINDTTIKINKDSVTWAPSTTVNFGISYTNNDITIALLAHYQGKVYRRVSDVYAGITDPRPAAIDPWFNINAKISYLVNPNLELGVILKNLANQKQYLVKNYAYPFDYRREPMQILGEIVLKL